MVALAIVCMGVSSCGAAVFGMVWNGNASLGCVRLGVERHGCPWRGLVGLGAARSATARAFGPVRSGLVPCGMSCMGMVSSCLHRSADVWYGKVRPVRVWFGV